MTTKTKQCGLSFNGTFKFSTFVKFILCFSFAYYKGNGNKFFVGMVLSKTSVNYDSNWASVRNL